MKKDIALEIFNNIEILLKHKELIAAQEYIQLEIDNIEHKTPKVCKGKYDETNDWICVYCTNKMCKRIFIN